MTQEIKSDNLHLKTPLIKFKIRPLVHRRGLKKHLPHLSRGSANVYHWLWVLPADSAIGSTPVFEETSALFEPAGVCKRPRSPRGSAAIGLKTYLTHFESLYEEFIISHQDFKNIEPYSTKNYLIPVIACFVPREFPAFKASQTSYSISTCPSLLSSPVQLACRGQVSSTLFP